jgi:hypothetical protein
VGWDSGLAVRYQTRGVWGWGFRLNPFILDETRDDANDIPLEDDEFGYQIGEEIADEDLGVAFMIFRHVPIGARIGVGPFAEIGYAKSIRSDEEMATFVYGSDFGGDTSTTRRSITRDGDSWALSLGLRPTFTFAGRFRLESRIAVRLGYDAERSDEWVNSRVIDNDDDRASRLSVSREQSDGWNVSVFGQQLGPGSLLSFTIAL